jgi:hypothetical protein
MALMALMSSSVRRGIPEATSRATAAARFTALCAREGRADSQQPEIWPDSTASFSWSVEEPGRFGFLNAGADAPGGSGISGRRPWDAAVGGGVIILR